MTWRRSPSFLTPAQQYMFLRRNPICAGNGGLNARGLLWEYHTRPTPFSRDYLLRIRFERGDIPKVFVKDPDLFVLAEGRELPHVYHDPLRLCLYLPGTTEWMGSMGIDRTFVPWAATWLFYFEEWLSSDEWKGGGEHPAVDDQEQDRRRCRRQRR
jgi:hypothetical protein